MTDLAKLEHRRQSARASQQRRRARQRRLGLCRECSSPVSPHSVDCCDVHRVKREQRLAAYWARKLRVSA